MHNNVTQMVNPRSKAQIDRNDIKQASHITEDWNDNELIVKIREETVNHELANPPKIVRTIIFCGRWLSSMNFPLFTVPVCWLNFESQNLQMQKHF